jgi:hypothetical protein
VVLYGRGTLSLTLREEHRLRVFENRVCRSKGEEGTGGWRKLHNEELHNSPNDLIKEDKMGEALRTHRR